MFRDVYTGNWRFEEERIINREEAHLEFGCEWWR